MASTIDEVFSPQPGDIIILQSPIKYPDGTYGSLVKIFKDNFFFTSDKIPITSKSPTHTFKRGEKILRLFKLYKNWEFVSCKTHELYLFYPGYESSNPWLKINTITNIDHLNCKSVPRLPNVRHFTHLPPSRLFSPMSKAEFLPRPRNIIIHTLPKVETKAPSSGEMCEKCWRSKNATLYWSLDANSPPSQPSHDRNNFDEISVGCDYCRLPHTRDPKPNKPWANRFGLDNWSETFEPRQGDYLVRYEVDAQYGGQLKKTRLQVELFGYIAHKKIWKYLGMDVADCGPIAQMNDIVYCPQPGDIIISKNLNWFARWDPYRQVGGYSMFYKDMNFFGNNEGGQNLWPDENENETKSNKVQKLPTDSWLVRLGFFDEYWEFHLNDRAEVFTLRENGNTMLLCNSTDVPHTTQAAQYKYNFEEKEPLLMSEVKIQPNEWDLVVRGIDQVHGDQHKTRDWKLGPHHWMKDSLLWGKDTPPRFDKEVELYTYWSGFSFEDKDLLLQVGFDSLDKCEIRSFNNDLFSTEDLEDTPFGPSNPKIPFFHTNASLDLYQVRVEEEEDEEKDKTKFLFLGRD